MTYLLDVNVIIALIDPAHVRNRDALAWFTSTGKHSWATCPLTENAVLRIVGHPPYPNSPGSPSVVANLLEQFLALPGHIFWPDDISILDRKLFSGVVMTSGQVTDSYLLALAVAHNGQLATLDRRLAVGTVRQGQPALHQII
jgi:toxin-antitoxin system PIN domain toxin